MTYSEIYDKAIKKLNLKQEDIEDYRPAAQLYIEQVNGTIPNGIIIWLKSGERIIYIEPETKTSESEEDIFVQLLETYKHVVSSGWITFMVERYVQINGPFSLKNGEKVRKILMESSES